MYISPFFRQALYNRPIRYSLIVAHTAKEKLDEVDVDLSGVEKSLQEQVNCLSEKVEQLMAKLEAMDNDTVEGPSEADDVKAKPKAKQSAKRS